MKILTAFLGGCSKVLPLVGIVTAVASIGLAVHEAKAKAKYRDAKLQLLANGGMIDPQGQVVDTVDEIDQTDDE